MLLLNPEERQITWKKLIAAIEDYIAHIQDLRVSPILDAKQIRAWAERFRFEDPVPYAELIDEVVDGLKQYQVHTAHPMYYGLFNPAPSTMGIAADTLVAAFNPQMAAWSHNPIAAEIENHIVRQFGIRFGYPDNSVDGTFCNGGAEANHTALLTALVSRFPEFSKSGVRALKSAPVFYVSAQSHHSFVKAARFCGIGTDAVRQVPVDDSLRMIPESLEQAIEKDLSDGFVPFLIVGTAGSTGAGAIDDLNSCSEIALRYRLWFHTDAAWGGAAVFVPKLREVLSGIERSDSITFDAHKWLSVPMAAGIYLTRHPDILSRTCSMAADYMPRDGAGQEFTDPYSHSLQWSRRFTGLKVFMTLAVAGWTGYERSIGHQIKMGNLLRTELQNSGWKIVNRTELPLVCFIDSTRADGSSPEVVDPFVQRVLATGKAWISMFVMKPGFAAARACITNYRTGEEEIRKLVEVLNGCR